MLIYPYLRHQQVLVGMAIPVELSDRSALIKSASTSLNSKVGSEPPPNLNFKVGTVL